MFYKTIIHITISPTDSMCIVVYCKVCYRTDNMYRNQNSDAGYTPSLPNSANLATTPGRSSE